MIKFAHYSLPIISHHESAYQSCSSFRACCIRTVTGGCLLRFVCHPSRQAGTIYSCRPPGKGPGSTCCPHPPPAALACSSLSVLIVSSFYSSCLQVWLQGGSRIWTLCTGRGRAGRWAGQQRPASGELGRAPVKSSDTACCYLPAPCFKPKRAEQRHGTARHGTA